MSWQEADVSHFIKRLFEDNKAEFTLDYKGEPYLVKWTPDHTIIDRQ